jgi:hypothetical protein
MFAGYAADFPSEEGRSIPGEIRLGPGSHEVGNPILRLVAK